MAKQRQLEVSRSADRAELRALLAAAKADHWDDGSRLALADWLEENGGEADRARAEVIRLQLDTDGGGPNWATSVGRLHKKYVRDWLPAHHDFFRTGFPECDRGLLSSIQAPSSWLQDGPLDEAWEWVESASPRGLSRCRDIPRLLAAPRLSTVARLDLGPNFSDPRLRTALAHLKPGPLRALSVSCVPASFGAIVDGLRPGLEEMTIRCVGDGVDWPALFRGAGMEGLRGLTLFGSGDLGGKAIAALGAAPGLADLRRLDIYWHDLPAAAIGALADLPLRRLEISSGYLGAAALACLADGACWATLEGLRVPGPGGCRPLSSRHACAGSRSRAAESALPTWRHWPPED